MEKYVRNIIESLAKDYNLPFEKVTEVVESPFRHCSYRIKTSDRENYVFPNIRIIKFGVFAVKEKRKEILKKQNEEYKTFKNTKKAEDT